MKSEDVFALAIRIAGLVTLIYLLSTAFMLIGSGMPWPMVIRAMALALLALWMIRGAPQLVRFAYPDRD